MRLASLERGRSLRAKMLFGIIRIVSRRRAPDVIRVLMHRPEFFGRDMNEVFQGAMRVPSPWPVGERELMAAFVSKTNECEF
mgnify:CR=1 FL=1